jgi:hypothetical protein
MADGAHDMGLTARLINGVFHGFTVNPQAFVILSMRLHILAQPEHSFWSNLNTYSDLI